MIYILKICSILCYLYCLIALFRILWVTMCVSVCGFHFIWIFKELSTRIISCLWATSEIKRKSKALGSIPYNNYWEGDKLMKILYIYICENCVSNPNIPVVHVCEMVTLLGDTTFRKLSLFKKYETYLCLNKLHIFLKIYLAWTSCCLGRNCQKWIRFSHNCLKLISSITWITF